MPNYGTSYIRQIKIFKYIGCPIYCRVIDVKGKYGCDMRGLLSFQILWLLSRRKMHGEEIAREIEKRRGDKPKPGTLYPALRELKGARLIDGEKSGKVIVYSLTASGERAVHHATGYFCKAFGDIFESA